MYEIIKTEKTEVEVKITLNKQEWETYTQKAYEQNKSKFNIQGFRKGAAPKKIIEKNYGEGVFYDEALDLAFADEYGKFLDENKTLEIIDQPSLNIEKFDAEGIIMVAKAPLMPEVKMGQYKGLNIQGYKEEFDEAKVEKELKQAIERGARYVEAEKDAQAKLGDFVTIDFTGSVNGSCTIRGSKGNLNRLCIRNTANEYFDKTLTQL